MQQISYRRPASVEEATEMLAEHGGNAVVLAGGQSLVQILKQRLAGAEYVVDISGLDELDRIEESEGENGDEGALTVGAMVTYERLRHHPVVQERIPVLAEALGTIGDVQIRSQGTFAGGIAHADPAGDPPVVATALDVDLHVASADGTRTVPASEFFFGLYETDLGPDELLTDVSVDLLPEGAFSTYRAVAPRKGDYASASLAVVLDPTPGNVTDASVVAGSVEDVPVRLVDVEEALAEEGLSESLVDRAPALAREAVDPYGDEHGSAEYKEALVGQLVSETLEDALAEVES